MKKLSPEEKEKLQQKIREYHERIMPVAGEANQRDGGRAKKPEPLSPLEEEILSTLKGYAVKEFTITMKETRKWLAREQSPKVSARTVRSGLVYVAPRIPLKKLSHARENCAVPEAERILGLIRLSGSAKNALLFGCEGVYYHNGWPRKGPRTGAISYSEFPSRGFRAGEKDVYLGVYNEFLKVRALDDIPQQVAAILNAIRQSVIRQQGGWADVEEQEEPEELKEEGLPAARKLTDEEERVIQARISKGAKGVISIRFEKDDLLLQQSSSDPRRLYQPSLSFYPGEVMRGKVLLYVAKTLKARRMYLSVEGKEKLEWWEWDTDEDGARIDTRRRDKHTIIVKTVPLLEERQEIQPGNYEYPFECCIPEESTLSTFRYPEFPTGVADVPSIYDYSCACEYSVSAHIDVPLRRDVRGKRSFQVSRLPMDRDTGTEPISFSATHDSQDITLSVTLQDAACPIGSQVEGSVAFQNYSRNRIRGIDVKLFCQEHVRVRRKTLFFFDSREIPWTREFQMDAIRIPVPEETIKEFQTDFSLSIPRSTPETGSWHFFDVRAFVKVNLVTGVFYVGCSHEIDILPAISPQ